MPKDNYEKREEEHKKSKTRIWCPLRSCQYNKNLRCTAKAIKLRFLHNSDKLECFTYKLKKDGNKYYDILDFKYKNINPEKDEKEAKIVISEPIAETIAETAPE